MKVIATILGIMAAGVVSMFLTALIMWPLLPIFCEIVSEEEDEEYFRGEPVQNASEP